VQGGGGVGAGAPDGVRRVLRDRPAFSENVFAAQKPKIPYFFIGFAN